MNESERSKRSSGLIYGIAAYGLWGLVPLYFAALSAAKPLEVLTHRVVWSVVFLLFLLTGLRRWPDVGRCCSSRRIVSLLSTSTVLIAINWFTFIYGVWSNQILQTSLGYFMTPLINVLLGMLFFREKLRPAQWTAVALATSGIAYLVWYVGAAPWIALTLAFSFGLYGLVRKMTPVDALVGLSVETLLLFPLALGAILFWAVEGTGTFGRDMQMSGLLAFSGVVTAIPLLCFGAARRLPLTIIGFLQYIAPTISCLFGVFWFNEPFREEQRISFGLIWTALALFSIESLLMRRSALSTPSASEGKGAIAVPSVPLARARG